MNGALVGTNNAHTLNRPTDSRAIVPERRERIGQQVALPLCYHRTPLSAVGLYDLLCHQPPHHHPLMLNDCTTLALTGLICTKKRRREEEEESGEGGSRRGRERKSSEWHHNITMHLEAQLANTAGPATVKRLMSHNSKETVGY